jgi:uncharacterized protein (DUF4415 family)
MGKKLKADRPDQADDTRARDVVDDPDNPEWTADDFRRARPVWDYPDLAGLLQRSGKLGRPPLPEDAKKQRVTMYLDRDVVDRLKADGKGWQTRANARLRAALGLG